jgi:hypothetical protein
MNKNAYLTLIGNLNLAVVDDPTALLALTVGWLDPLAILDDLDDLAETDLADFYYSEDDMGAALRAARDCFPGIYAAVIGKIRVGANYQEASSFISAEITTQTGIPIDNYDEPAAYAFGIPLPFYGAEWEQGDFIESNPELTDLALLLGATHEQTRWGETIEFSNRAYQVAHILQNSLGEHDDNPLHRSVMWAMAHCTSSSGNSSVDLPYDVGIEFQPLAWLPDEVDFASAIIREAEQILTEAQAGLQHIQTDAHIRQSLLDKINEAKRIVDQLQRRGKTPSDYITDDNKNPFGLRWDSLHTSPVRNPAADAECIQLRLDAA